MESKKSEARIMAFGTFDGLHKGHINFFRQARKLSQKTFLIVSVARDMNVKKIKGARPTLSEKKRISLIKKSNQADKVVLGGAGNYLAHIIKERPDIIALGYDQRAYVKDLKKELKQRGMKVQVVRMKAYQPNIYKNHLLKSKKGASAA